MQEKTEGLKFITYQHSNPRLLLSPGSALHCTPVAIRQTSLEY